MDNTIIYAEIRKNIGKTFSRFLRKNKNMIPGIIYGLKKKNIPTILFLIKSQNVFDVDELKHCLNSPLLQLLFYNFLNQHPQSYYY